MNESIPKRYAGWIGLGVMFMWGFALVFWADLLKSNNIVTKTLGLLGAGITSASGIAIFLYASSLEQEVARLKELSESNATEARFWRNQAEEVPSKREAK